MYTVYWILLFIIILSFITGNIVLLVEYFQKSKKNHIIQDDEIL